MATDIKIYAYKHNESFHRFWSNQKIIKSTKDYYIIASPRKSKVYESNGYYWFSKEFAISYFSKHRWFNVILMYKRNELVYYCNLATPIVYENNSLKYIDYDIDVKYYPKRKKYKILDLKEYDQNKKEHKYEKWIDAKIKEELETLLYWIKHEIGPFSPTFAEEMRKLYEKEVNDGKQCN